MHAMERRLMIMRVLMILLFSCLLGLALGQGQNTTGPGSNTTAPALDPQIVTSEEQCVGVFLVYEVIGRPERIYPYVATASEQAYKFSSDVTLTNTGFEPLTQWEVSIGFQHKEVIARAPDVLFLSGLSPPGLAVGNDTRIIGVAQPDLLTSIDTAQDPTLITAKFSLTGTEFGVNETGFPLPANLTLVNDGYKCGGPALNASASPSRLWVCCTENATAINMTTGRDSGFLPRLKGDITMFYDVMESYESTYTAQVSINLDNALVRIDNWNVSWEWRQGEFIQDMKGAQILGPNEQDKCVFGPAAQQYGSDSSVNFGTVMSCSPTPQIVDLTPDRKNDGTVGIPHCCRNGSLLPALIDPSQALSQFQVRVRKLPPHMAQDDLAPPVNWNIADGYLCSQPRKVSPSEFDPQALHSSSAVASWQIVCNITEEPVKKCCVSFSAYFNDSLVPCPTCACGCSSNRLPWNGDVCNPNIQPMLLPYRGVLVPPSNRTSLAADLAAKDHYQVPKPVPCPDNCGVSINWHVYSDYTDGWSARITLFNWQGTEVPDWSAAIQMPVAMPGFQDVYSFNGSKVPDRNNTLFIQGHNGYDNNYLLAKDSSDNPGKLQSILSFDKRRTPGIQVSKGDGYPSKVWFNGEECAIPEMFPQGSAKGRVLPRILQLSILLATILAMNVL